VSPLQVRELPQRAKLAEVIAAAHGVAACGERDDGAASGAFRRFKGGRVFQHLEVELIRAKEDNHLRFDGNAALAAILPAPFMAFAVVRTAELASVVPAAAVGVEREEHVVVLIIADPVATAFSFHEPLRCPAQAAAGQEHRPSY
jgi:hypothetical protein